MTSVRSTVLASAPISWEDAVADFILLIKGTREEKTTIFYRNRMSVLSKWAKENGVCSIEYGALLSLRYAREWQAK